MCEREREMTIENLNMREEEMRIENVCKTER